MTDGGGIRYATRLPDGHKADTVPSLAIHDSGYNEICTNSARIIRSQVYIHTVVLRRV